MHYLENKNPKNREGTTPLHLAAENGFYDICKIITESIQNCDKNPVDGIGRVFFQKQLRRVLITFLSTFWIKKCMSNKVFSFITIN